MLEEHGYRARIVIERLDGGAITDADRVVLNDATSAAEEHGTASPQVRERVVAGHLARSRTRLAAKGTPSRKAPVARARDSDGGRTMPRIDSGLT